MQTLQRRTLATVQQRLQGAQVQLLQALVQLQLPQRTLQTLRLRLRLLLLRQQEAVQLRPLKR
jgi:hypothetical protein